MTNERLELMRKELVTARQRVKAIESDIEDEEKEEKIKRQKPLRKIAEKAHGLFCQWNHTDGCGWGYEGNNWDGHAHQRWLKKIENTIKDGYPRVTLNELDIILDDFILLQNKHKVPLGHIISTLRRS